MDKEGRVTGKGGAVDIIGRVGTVTHVFLRNEVEYATLFEERAGGKAGSFVAPSAHLQLETEVVQAELKPATCDFRKLREPVLIEMGQRLLIHAQDLEPMVNGQTTEFMTLTAGLIELEARFADPKVIIVPPAQTLSFVEGGFGEDKGKRTRSGAPRSKPPSRSTSSRAECPGVGTTRCSR